MPPRANIRETVDPLEFSVEGGEEGFSELIARLTSPAAERSGSPRSYGTFPVDRVCRGMKLVYTDQSTDPLDKSRRVDTPC